MREMLQEISNVLSSREEVVHDVPNLDPKDPCVIVDPPKLDSNSQQEFRIGDHVDGSNMVEAVSDLIGIESDIIVDVATDIKVEKRYQPRRSMSLTHSHMIRATKL
ncbi:hypothetical protein J1N35_014162, partial [Gossypium stocksii]